MPGRVSYPIRDVGGVSNGPSEGAASILDTLRVGTVMLDGNGRILLWNPMTEEILGWRAEQVVGRRIQDFLEDGYGEGERRRDDALKRERRWRGTMSILHSAGHRVAVEGRVSLLYDARDRPVVLANIVETSRIRSVEHDLAALDALFESSPLGIALFDTDKRFVRVNEALARLDQVPVDEHHRKDRLRSASVVDGGGGLHRHVDGAGDGPAHRGRGDAGARRTRLPLRLVQPAH